MPKIKKKTIAIYFMALIILYVIIAIIPGLTGLLTRTEIIEYGNMRISDEVTGYIVRDETVYTSADKGSVKYLVEEGTQVKAGIPVWELTAMEGGSSTEESDQSKSDGGLTKRLGSGTVVDETYTSQRKGVLTYYIDGYETYFTLDKIGQFKYDQVKEFTDVPINTRKDKASDRVKEGEPVYKICDNSKWYLVCWIDKASIPNYEVGKKVTIILPEGEIKGTVANITEDGDKWQVSIITNRHYTKFTAERRVKATIRTVDTNGLLITNGCLTGKDGQVGVYVRETTGDFAFRPVQVIISDGKKTLVSEGTYFDSEGKGVKTVNVYDEVLKHPKTEEKDKKSNKDTKDKSDKEETNTETKDSDGEKSQ